MKAMPDPIAGLADLLQRAIALLDAHDEAHWATWLRGDRERILAGDANGLTHLLGAFGGMGSLNDVVFQPRQDDAAERRRSEQETELLRQLLERIYLLARDLERGT